MNPPHSQVDSSDQLTSQTKGRTRKDDGRLHNQTWSIFLILFFNSSPTQANTFIPLQSQGQTSTDFEKVLQEYLNTTGVP